MNKITPFMGWQAYPAFGLDWQEKWLTKLAEKISPPGGALVAVLPAEARFKADLFDDGIFERWQRTDLDDSAWRTMRTTAGWQSQGLRDRQGHPYRGLAWYRLKVRVPGAAGNRTVRLFCPAALNEVWLWVNGRYVGRRGHRSPWHRSHGFGFDFDVSDALQRDAINHVTLRIRCTTDNFGASGIYERMFLYSPKARAGSQRKP